jgi:hypothetical protein
VEEKLYQPLIVHRHIVLKKNIDLEIEEWKTPEKKIMLLHFIQTKEEDSKETSEKTFKIEKCSSNPSYNQRRYVSEIQCFRCDKYGYYARNCPTRKKGRQYASTTNIDPDPPQNNEEKREEKYFL